jgi:YgiT-type zinc finger domain-containing protein
MNCIICRQAEIVDGFTTIPFERDELKLIVNAVPARICPNCSEAYLDEKVGIQLLRFAEEMSSMGVIEDVCEYSEIPAKDIS